MLCKSVNLSANLLFCLDSIYQTPICQPLEKVLEHVVLMKKWGKLPFLSIPLRKSEILFTPFKEKALTWAHLMKHNVLCINSTSALLGFFVGTMPTSFGYNNPIWNVCLSVSNKGFEWVRIVPLLILRDNWCYWSSVWPHSALTRKIHMENPLCPLWSQEPHSWRNSRLDWGWGLFPWKK